MWISSQLSSMSGPRRAPPNEERTAESDPPLSRRTLLDTAGIALVTTLAGCSAGASQQTAPTPLVDETVHVEPGQYETVEFSLDEERWTTVSAYLSDRSLEVKHDGPGVDVVVMSPGQYSQFQETRTFDYVGGVSMPNVVNGEVSATLPPGDYVVLVDDTSTGSAKPGSSSDPAVVKLEVSASERQG